MTPDETTPTEPVGTLVLRLLIARAQNDDELVDLQLRRLYASGQEGLYEAVRCLAFDLASVLHVMWGDDLERRLREALWREIGVAGDR